MKDGIVMDLIRNSSVKNNRANGAPLARLFFTLEFLIKSITIPSFMFRKVEPTFFEKTNLRFTGPLKNVAEDVD